MECTRRNLITRVLTFYPRNQMLRVLTNCHVKLAQSTALEQKRLDLWSVSPAFPNLWLLLVIKLIVIIFIIIKSDFQFSRFDLETPWVWAVNSWSHNLASKSHGDTENCQTIPVGTAWYQKNCHHNRQILYQFNFGGKPVSNSNLIPVKCRFAKVCGKTLIAYSLGYLLSYRPE